MSVPHFAEQIVRSPVPYLPDHEKTSECKGSIAKLIRLGPWFVGLLSMPTLFTAVVHPPLERIDLNVQRAVAVLLCQVWKVLEGLALKAVFGNFRGTGKRNHFIITQSQIILPLQKNNKTYQIFIHTTSTICIYTKYYILFT